MKVSSRDHKQGTQDAGSDTLKSHLTLICFTLLHLSLFFFIQPSEKLCFFGAKQKEIVLIIYSLYVPFLFINISCIYRIVYVSYHENAGCFNRRVTETGRKETGRKEGRTFDSYRKNPIYPVQHASSVQYMVCSYGFSFFEKMTPRRGASAYFDALSQCFLQRPDAPRGGVRLQN